MRAAFGIAIIVCGIFGGIGTAVAQTDPDTPLSVFLKKCKTDGVGCTADLAGGYEASKSMYLICPPADLSEEAALNAELAWLHNAAATDPAMAKMKELDAEDKAQAALWPCKH